MAFVNEFVSEGDIKKYGLDALWHRWNPFHHGKLPPGYRHAWTFDRERNAFFIPMASGREEHSNQKNCVLFWRGIEWQVDVDLVAGSSGMLDEVPFKRVWELARIQHPRGEQVPRDEIVPVLKDALTAYGYWGAHRQMPNTVVEFKF